MIDTIKLNALVGNEECLRIAKLLDKKYTVLNDKEDNVKVEGKFNNFKIQIFRSSIFVIGSLPKYCKGTNLEVLTLQEIRDAIDRLSEELGVNFWVAKATRIDIGANIEVRKPIHHYLNVLKGISKFKKYGYSDSTLEFRNSKESIIFYDKITEMRAHKRDIPSYFWGKKILRFELRMIGSLKYSLDEDTLLEDILSEDVFNQLICRWYKRYNAIKKVPAPCLEAVPKDCTLKDFMNIIISAGIYSIGYDNIINDLDASKDLMSKNNYSRIKKRLNDIISDKSIFIDNSIITELDEHINNIAKSYGVI